jgi:murein DD-endopeptidase MepM/ murein hydrolase activator NlpD
LIFAVIFSFGILGQVDTRMHIGGSDWDLDSLIYINVDDYLLGDFASQDDAQVDQELPSAPPAPLHTRFSLDGATEVASKSSEHGPLEIKGNEEESLTPETVARVEATVPVAEPPQVQEKEQEKAIIFVHKVHSGETLWDIASAYGVTMNTILSANDLANPNRLSIGQELHIPSVNGILHQVATGESLWEISERYDVPMDEITRVNEITDPSRIQPNTKLVIPGATQLKPRDVLLVNGQLQKAFDWPVRGRISSSFGPRWGRMHNGLDIAVSTGTQVKAAADGRITFAGWNGGYGILVIIDHGNGIETRYAHNSRLNVKVGQRVTRGETVAYSGNTGVSTGPHVHFEIRYRNNPVNPQTYLK